MIGVVAIGRNEGDRLRRCLTSALADTDLVVYVDSGSTDGSVAMAEAMGVAVARLDPAGGFTAGRARNLGFARLAEGGAPPCYVQFVDGDCELRPGWIALAARALDGSPQLAAVAGRRRERAPQQSIFNQLCDMEWNTPVGEAEAIGGDAMYRAEAFAAAGGFDPSLICGEEPELCLRLRRACWRIERLDAEMTLHDAAILRWSQWVRRTMRGGWAFAEGAAMHGSGPERYNRRQARSLWVWGAAAPAAVLLCLLLAAALAATGAASWPWPLAAAGLGLAAYGAMALRVALFRRRRFGDPWRHALLYGAMVMLGKVPEALGALRRWRAARRGDRATIIEYKHEAGPRPV